MSGSAPVMISPSNWRIIRNTPWVAGCDGPMFRVSFSPRSSESLIASSDLAARARVSGVSVARVVIGIAESDQVDEDMVFLFRVARRILRNVCPGQKAEFARK